jgi:hypothetical protein
MLFFLPAICLVACPSVANDDATPDAMPPDACPEPIDPEWEIWRGYNDAVWTYALDNDMPGEWWQWMLSRKDRYREAYVRARTDRRVRVEVRYDIAVPYDPPWADEDEHMQALERMAELAYPGWDFSFSLDDPDAEFHAVLGHSGEASYASGDTVHLIWEGIFLHEFAHLLGLGHHYCGSDVQAPCPDRPPGEGKCIMDRNSATWGPTEQFLLNLGQQRHDDAVEAAIDEINGRYPADWP